MDRNARVRVMHAIETMERMTKRYGCRNGCLGKPAVEILRALLFRFQGRAGCFPSYDTIMEKTGLCRASVASGLKNLENCGVLLITRGKAELWMISGRVVPRKPCNRYAFRELPRYFLPEVPRKSPEKSIVSTIVHRLNRTQTAAYKQTPFWLGKTSEVGSAGDWRSRARALITVS